MYSGRVGGGWMDDLAGIFFRKLVGCFGVYSAYPQMVEYIEYEKYY